MCWRKLLALIAPPVVVVLVGVIVALCVPADNQTLRIGVFTAVVVTGGFCLNYFKTAYEIWKKEDENKERVKAQPVFASHGTNHEFVGVEVYNSGTSPIIITRVGLVHMAGNEIATEYLPSVEAAKELANEWPDDPSFYTEEVSRLELEPKRTARWYLDRDTEWTTDCLLNRPADTYWIVIESFMGEVARVPGEAIQAAIRKRPYGRALVAIRACLDRNTNKV